MNSFQTEYVILISKSKMEKWGVLSLIDNVIQSCSCSNHFLIHFSQLNIAVPIIILKNI